MKVIVCPACGSKSFMVTGVEYHDWIVDGNGCFLEDLGPWDSDIASSTDWHCQGEGCEASFMDGKGLVEIEE